MISLKGKQKRREVKEGLATNLKLKLGKNFK